MSGRGCKENRDFARIKRMNIFFVSLAGFLCVVIVPCPNPVLYFLILTPNFSQYNFHDIPNFTANDLHFS